MLTQDKLQEQLHYNPKTGLFSRAKTCTRKYKKTGYLTSTRYIKIRVFGKEYFAHRLIWLYVYGEFPKNDLDHINGIRDDNRLCNLREATRSQNCHNQKKPHSRNSVGFLGVDFHNASKKYRARIGLNTKSIFIGLFDNPKDAHEAYLTAKRKLHEFSTI